MTAINAGRLRINGTTMPMKVTTIAKSSPQLAGSWMYCPAITPISVHSTQFEYINSSEPSRYQCLYSEASGASKWDIVMTNDSSVSQKASGNSQRCDSPFKCGARDAEYSA